MENNITSDDLGVVIDFLKTSPVLTQSTNVEAFEQEWSKWLGVKHSVFVNSGSSANILTLAALKAMHGTGEIILAPFGWISDIVAVINNGFTPVFADINPHTLSLDSEQAIARITDKTKAVLLVHTQGFNGLSDKLLAMLREKNIPLIEDVCESHGATHNNKPAGTFGNASNFSFYYAHHMSTIEGGMVCTSDRELYETVRMLRSHGLVRESSDEELKKRYSENHPDLSPDFIFAFPGYNMRNTEIGAVIGRNQLKRLDWGIAERQNNLKLFLENLDPARYQTDFRIEGSSSYAFNLILKNPDTAFCERVMDTLRKNKIEFRRGSAGGGNQLRQPYMKDLVVKEDFTKFPVLEHVHFFGMYIGNYPGLTREEIAGLCELVNGVNL